MTIYVHPTVDQVPKFGYWLVWILWVQQPNIRQADFFLSWSYGVDGPSIEEEREIQ